MLIRLFDVAGDILSSIASIFNCKWSDLHISNTMLQTHKTQAKSLILAALVASASAFVPARPVAMSRSTSLFMAEGVEERVRELVKSQLNPDSDFEDSASFMDDLGADSLDAVELIMSLEEEFEIEIPDDEVEGITTVQAAIDFVKSKQ